MTHVSEPHIARWSTRDVPRADRLDYWVWLLSSSLTPVRIDKTDPESFESEMRAATLGSVIVLGQEGAAQRCYRDRAEIRRSEDRTFNLILSVGGAWDVTHKGRFCLKAGDWMFHDSEYPASLESCAPYQQTNVVFPESWVRTWLPNPGLLVGRPIPRDSKWGRLLAQLLGALSPEMAVTSPIPPTALADQVGVLLALTSSELAGEVPASTQASRSLGDRVRDQIIQRCQEQNLKAVDVARSLGVSTRTLHRSLAASGELFGTLVIGARAALAVRMLRSPLFDGLTVAEIGRRAGFQNSSHMSRAVRRMSGLSPREVRKHRSRAPLRDRDSDE